jgi:hypothetical protein
MRDLNAIRDGNVGRVGKTGCSPEVAARIVELKILLGQTGGSTTGIGIKAGVGSIDPNAIAARWFEAPRATGNADDSERVTRQLEAVLPNTANTGNEGANAKASAGSRAGDLARAKAELDVLESGCPAASTK